MIFRALEKRDDLEAAISVLCTMKGVSPAFASAVLVAFRPEKVPYMSDEALLSLPDGDEVDAGTDPTTTDTHGDGVGDSPGGGAPCRRRAHCHGSSTRRWW